MTKEPPRGPLTNNALQELFEVRRRMNSSDYSGDGYSRAEEDVQSDIEYLIRQSKNN